MTQGYIIQFYHPIEADLPEDIREDWMQWHHEELIRDNRVFETVQLKLDFQNLGMPLAFLYSRKDKVFTTEEQNTIDKICRNLGKYTKKKFKINFSIDENRDYGSTWTDKYGEQRDRVTQTMNYEYIFSDCKFNLQVNKLFALNNKESEELLRFRKCDYYIDITKPLPKNVRAKDICGITLVSRAKFKKHDPKFYDFGYEEKNALMTSTILISYNSKWQKELEDKMSKFFKSIAKHVK